MARVIAIAQQKGGAGKTTTAAAISAGLSRQGKKVLAIDLDGQRNLTFALKGLNVSQVTAADVLQGEDVQKAIIHNPGGDLTAPVDLMPASDQLSVLHLTSQEWQQTLSTALKPIQRKYDYIIIDTPPQLGQILACALTAANGVIIPTLPDFFSLQGVNQICQTIDQARAINKDLSIIGILITKYHQRKILDRDTASLIERTATAYNTKVFTTKIRECIALAEAIATQTDIFTYAPRSTGAEDYNNIIKDIIQ